ncbi:helix-turn-helix domain-containing protein [Haloferula sp. A504]|uniref:AraC family transcriptional regulator n=1 Tax=Haloferula sp. A504 TaxID=3373601 RepID=UPI0031C8C6A3|nr:helix-turn-helix domain-containing protein [Verrucomicrobiaceae bacterium E54]
MPAIIDGAGAYARQHGLRLDARWSVRADWMPEHPGWDGVLVHLVDMESAYLRAAALGVPMVHLSGWFAERALPRVECDYAACGVLAAEEFRRLGLSRVVGRNGVRSSIDWRAYRGLRVGARREGLEFIDLPPGRKGVDWTSAVEGLANAVAALRFPCGLFLPHAGGMIDLLDLLVQRGVRVPQDLAMIVVDKDPQRNAELAPVPFTGIVPDFWQQGYEAAGLLHRMIIGEARSCSIRRVPPVGVVRRESTGVAGSRDPVVAKVIHLLGESAGRTLGVAELARLAGVSRRTLEMRFRRETGMTLHALQTKLRMDEAKRLLGSAKRTVTEVAIECGFSSVHYFTTAFKREVGVTPGAFRSERRG